MKQCPQCQVEFTPFRKDQQFCSPKCRNKTNARRAYLRMKESGLCYRCHKPRDGWQKHCDECRIKILEYARSHPEWRNKRAQVARRKLLYGVTEDEYEQMMDSQGGGCAICGKRDRRFHIDHDHRTGVVRGILCGQCNAGLGMFGDDAGITQSAAKYLLKYS